MLNTTNHHMAYATNIYLAATRITNERCGLVTHTAQEHKEGERHGQQYSNKWSKRPRFVLFSKGSEYEANTPGRSFLRSQKDRSKPFGLSVARLEVGQRAAQLREVEKGGGGKLPRVLSCSSAVLLVTGLSVLLVACDMTASIRRVWYASLYICTAHAPETPCVLLCSEKTSGLPISACFFIAT